MNRRKVNRRIENIIKELKHRYDSVGKPNHGMIKVVNRGNYGFFNTDGIQVIPFEYDWASSFVRIKLYGTTYIGAYVTQGNHKMIIDVDNNNIITPMDMDTRYYIINDKLWVKDESGYNLVSRTGKKLLSNDYDLIVNDRFRQPKNVYLVEKNGKYGAIHVSHNNKESAVLPLSFKNLSFWYAPTLGTFIKVTKDGKIHGLYKLDGSMAIPFNYQTFEFLTPFRKGFILASNDKEYTLYAGEECRQISSSPYPIEARYAFYWQNISYYSVHTVTQDLLIDKDCHIVTEINKKTDISCFHYLMNLEKESFRFASLEELLQYCQKIKKGKINLTPSVKSDLVTYGFYYLEMELHKYATMHHFDYSRLALHDLVSDKKRSWGTCHTYERAISLNLNLLFTSMEFIKVVILHELVHFKNASHNRYFYRTLNELYGSDTRKIKMNPINILDTVDAVGILKRKTRDLFASAVQKGLQSPASVSIHDTVVYEITQFADEYQVAALEK